MGNDPKIADVKRTLFYKVSQLDSGVRSIWYYEDPSHPAEKDIPQPQQVLTRLRSAINKPRGWQQSFSTSERLIAELVLLGRVEPFVVKYYSVGRENKNDNQRIASFFVYSDDKDHTPLLSGYLDYPKPPSRDRVEKFFPKAASNRTWKAWAHSAFVSIHRVQPVLRVSAGDSSYVGLFTDARLESYPRGFIQGGLPFGAENKFLSLCDIESRYWPQVLRLYRSVFSVWNRVCRHENLERVFIEGDPGAGKELWYEAIREGAHARLSTKQWAQMSAALDTGELITLLYGERQGNLEREGYLKRCDGGGIFLDEIGKSTASFRSSLLRVLESKEFVPRGGEPLQFKRILFVFASTPQDIKNAADPPDFWTRMDTKLRLPRAIKLQKNEYLHPVDQARFYALFVCFWFGDIGGIDREFNTVQRTRNKFVRQVFSPLVAKIKAKWKRKAKTGLGPEIPISPRRIRSLARMLAKEYRWLAPSLERIGGITKIDAQKNWRHSLDELADEFLEQIIVDEENRLSSMKLALRKQDPVNQLAQQILADWGRK